MKIWKELLNLPEHLTSLSVLSDFRVTRSLVLCICFPDRCPFVLFLLAIVFSILVRFTYFNYPSGIIKLFLYRFLNRPETDIPLPIWKTIEVIDAGPIRKEDIFKVLKNLRNGKPGGVDGITAKILKEDIETTTKHLEKSFNIIWEKEVLPSDWNKGSIFKIPKEDRAVCDNYRSVTLLSIPSKVFPKINLKNTNGSKNKAKRRTNWLWAGKNHDWTTIYSS